MPASGIPRLLEAAAATAGLVVAAPVLGAAAVAIRMTSPGPVLFRQTRVGLHGRPFTMLKLRTMRTDNAGASITADGDSRITPIGRILRKTKLDELPELWNVARGDMSLVGPRPEVPQLVDLESPLWREVLLHRPGITDPVTLRLRNEEELLASASNPETFYREVLQPYKLRGYAEYGRLRSTVSDVRVLVDTALAVLRPSRVPPPTLDELQG